MESKTTEEIEKAWIERIGLKQFEMLKKASKLYEYIHNKEKFHHGKWDRARKAENQEFHWDKYKMYSQFSSRCSTLLFKLRSKEKFGDGYSEWRMETPEKYTKRIKSIKDKRRIEFESTYRVRLHFFQNRLNADYGTFRCNKCGSTFHHSPSTVYLGAEMQYLDCCGHCVNSIMRRNQQEEIYV